MDSAQETGDRRPDERHRWAFFFSVDGDLRFISHHDTLRMFRRAFARIALPLRFSQGFNPQPRITIPLPRPVGIVSDAEAIVVETTEPIDPEASMERLQNDTPNDLRVTGVRKLGTGEKLQPDLVRYRVEPCDPPIADVDDRIERLLNTDVVPVERKNPKKRTVKTLDVRPYIDQLKCIDGVIEMTLRVTGKGTAKPAEIAALIGYPGEAINHRIRRLEIQWQ